MSTDEKLRDELRRVAGCQRHSQRANRLVVMIQQLLAEERERCWEIADKYRPRNGDMIKAIRPDVLPSIIDLAVACGQGIADHIKAEIIGETKCTDCGLSPRHADDCGAPSPACPLFGRGYN